MGSQIKFTKPCTTCGRNLEIPVVHLGREVACSHCGARFIASINQAKSNQDDMQSLDERVDRLLCRGVEPSERFRYLAPTGPETAGNSTYEV